ncbi:MAG: DUF6293 family protein [Candidatus Parvarchaeota archaeon]|nr:DUF6293 family protein [Candidatus Jingweiarchaeum tengchongense]MCW1297703.1 DUF6293 family protein [Candidatus Jingweiarchaeum tengchongense]MCW1299714.1 DUF6293 family protein [Candidatus Jingweiarchaeum tengchongense]MCW1304318.1 DUF6293 family protein [Candidatus Jingweiarchaeum tengchongense]MCW1305699.1 DUF6293 family protein [Candidatus Jingweiarchaeum tengchongense]
MENILAIFVSVDLNRNLYGISKYIGEKKIEKVYLLYNKLNNFFGRNSREITDIIQEKLNGIIECEKFPINPESFEECFKELYKLIKKERNKTIYVDVSSTTKSATVATFSLASVFNIIPYIVIPEENKETSEAYIKVLKKMKYRKGIALYEIPIIKNEKIMNDKEAMVLKILKKNKGKVEGMGKILRLFGKKVTKKELTKLGYLLEKMEKKNLIITKKEGRIVIIKMTHFGKLISETILEAME